MLVDLRRLHVCLESVQVQADFAGDTQHRVGFYLATHAHQSVVELSILALLSGCECGACGKGRSLAEDWPFAHHQPDVAVFGQKSVDFRHGALAVGAVVVKELDHRDIALQIA